MDKSISIGWCIARITKGASGSITLRIVSPSDGNDNYFVPAESIAVYGNEPIKKLHELLSEALQEEAPHGD